MSAAPLNSQGEDRGRGDRIAPSRKAARDDHPAAGQTGAGRRVRRRRAGRSGAAAAPAHRAPSCTRRVEDVQGRPSGCPDADAGRGQCPRTIRPYEIRNASTTRYLLVAADVNNSSPGVTRSPWMIERRPRPESRPCSTMIRLGPHHRHRGTSHIDPGCALLRRRRTSSTRGRPLRGKRSGADFHPNLVAQQIDQCFDKINTPPRTPASRVGTPAARGLPRSLARGRPPPSVTMYGIATDYCVRATALNTAWLGYSKEQPSSHCDRGSERRRVPGSSPISGRREPVAEKISHCQGPRIFGGMEACGICDLDTGPTRFDRMNRRARRTNAAICSSRPGRSRSWPSSSARSWASSRLAVSWRTPAWRGGRRRLSRREDGTLPWRA